jgi:hypothetical protein
MPNPNALVAHVNTISPAPRVPRVAAEAAALEAMTVNFWGDRTAVLPPSRRAAVWRRMLEFTQQYRIPAYVEIDPETSVITRVLIPMRVKVVAIEPAAAGDVDVRFIESHAGHHLLRSNPDFHDMLNALQAALDAQVEVLVTSTRDEHEIIDVRPVPPPPPSSGSSPSPGGGYEDPPPSVVSEAQAAQLFNDMAATSCDPFTVPPPCIPFLYPDDGCYARAHEMIRLMRLQGIEGEKIWIYASSDSSLEPATSNHPDCKVNWWYHVAPTLQVNTTSGIEKRVIDPSLMTGPATANDWRTRQNDPAATFQFTDAQPFFPNGTTDDTYALTNQYLAEKRLYLQERVNDFGPLPYTCPIVKQLQFILDRSTFGQDEVTAMLQTASPAVIESALYVTLDGFTPQEIGITSSTPTDPPTLKPTLTVNPPIAQMDIKAAHLDMEDPAHLIRRQRITWTYDVRFTGISGFNFGGPTQMVSLNASISGESASASLLLIKQPDPYEIDGATHWLSTDLRVFQINAGQSKFGATVGATAAQALAFIQQVINNLNAGTTGGQTFDNDLSTDQETSKLELSEAVNGTNVFNFAVARVRYIGTLQAQNVRVFFRLFPASTTSLAYNTTTTYRRGGQGAVTIPLLGVINNQLVTIPCFASTRVDSATTSLNAQTDLPNVQTIPISGTERKVYFGAWLDFNQTAPQFPLAPTPSDGPWAANRKSIQEVVRAKHQCLVAEIAFDPAPIPSNATPATSDKLAQRNLAIVESANPGIVASRRIPQTFEIRPTPAKLPEEAPYDELMIDWGRTPVGSVATLYLPDVDSEEVLDLAARMYRTTNLVLIDEHTLQTRTGGMSWIPIPKGGDTNFTGMITIDLPPTIRDGQAFTVVVRQVTGVARSVVGVATAAAIRTTRHILGSFQITIPVRRKEFILAPEQRLLSNLRWIERAIPATDRWYSVFRRYVSQVASRVDALGGDSNKVAPSPSGDWQRAVPTSVICRSLELTTSALLAILFILGATSGAVQVVLGLIVLALLLVVGFTWVKNCRPSGRRLSATLVLGVVVGLIVLLLLRAAGP